MRIYHFGNFYMSSIQQGIQAAHCQMEMFLKYNAIGANKDSKKMLYEWARYHKTMICLNAGANKEMHEIRAILEDTENPYPWSYFKEEEEAMAGMLTNLAVILPEKIYGQRDRAKNGNTLWGYFEYAPTDRIYASGEPISEVVNKFSEYELKMLNLINGYRLAS